MTYYRLANGEDFKNFDVHFKNHTKMDDSTKLLIEQDELIKATQRIMELYGFGLYESLIYCKEYMSYVSARRDYEDGKNVYTEY